MSSILVFSFKSDISSYTVINNLLDCQRRSQSHSVVQSLTVRGCPHGPGQVSKLYNRLIETVGHGSMGSIGSQPVVSNGGSIFLNRKGLTVIEIVGAK